MTFNLKFTVRGYDSGTQTPSDKEELDGCSSVAVLPDASANGHTILAQNWDTYTWQEYGTVILQILRDDGPDLMIVTEAGQLARYGMNQAGIALGVNSLQKHIILKFWNPICIYPP